MSGLIARSYQKNATTPLGKQSQASKARPSAVDSDSENLFSAGEVDEVVENAKKSRPKGGFSAIVDDSDEEEELGDHQDANGVDDDDVKAITDASKHTASPVIARATKEESAAAATTKKAPAKSRATAASATKRKRAESANKAAAAAATTAAAAATEEPPAKSKKKDETAKTYDEMMEYLANHNVSEPNRSYIARYFASLFARRFLDIGGALQE